MIVVDELLALLRQSTGLAEKLGATAEDDKVYPLGTTDVEGNSLVYSYTGLISNGIIEQGRLTLKAISKDVFMSLEIMEAAKNAIITYADIPKTAHIKQVVQSGGSDPQKTVVGSYVVVGLFNVTNISYQY